MKQAIFGMAVLTLLGVLTACGLATPSSPEPATPLGQPIVVGDGQYRNINAAQLHGMLQNKDFVLINVHIPYCGRYSRH